MRKTFYILAIALMVVGCEQPRVQTEAILVEKSNKVTPFSDVIERIELVPLETGPAFLLGTSPSLELSADGYVLTDSRTGRVLYFGQDGAFRAHIGARGRGPGEYPMLLNSQVTADGNIVVFSYPDKVMYFGTDGELIREEHPDELGAQCYLVPEGLLIYFGFGSVTPDRVVLRRADGSQKGFLTTDANVINMTPGTPVFCTFDGTVYFTDTYNPTVYSYKDGKVSEEVTFDFGKSAIVDKFYHSADPYAGTDLIMKAPNGFSLVRRYARNDRYQFLESILQRNEQTEIHYGFSLDGVWSWFSLGDTGKSPFAGSMQVLDGNCLYFLLNADALSADDHGFGGNLAPLRELVANPEVLARVTTDDNPVVAKIFLK